MYIKHILTMVLISILLIGCGIKGSLYLPNESSDNSVKSSKN